MLKSAICASLAHLQLVDSLLWRRNNSIKEHRCVVRVKGDAIVDLIYRDTVFTSSASTQQDLFDDVGSRLQSLNLVTDDFIEKISQRELAYPTGIDMGCVCPGFPSYAIPHTDPAYVKAVRVVPVKIERPIEWRCLMNPVQRLSVSFAFMILNGDGTSQVGILSQIIDFVNGLGAEGASSFFNESDEDLIYDRLSHALNDV